MMNYTLKSETLVINFKNNKNLALKGILTRSKENKRILVLFIHGYASSKESETYTTLSESLKRKDIPNFRFDLSGHGESKGNFKDVTVSQALEDVKAAINLLKNLGYKKFIIVGSSFGGYLATHIAAHEKSTLKVILKAPVLDYLKLINERVGELTEKQLSNFKKQGCIYYQKNRKLYWKLYEDIIKNKYTAEKGILKCKMPIIVIHGDADKVVPFKHSQEICSQLENCKLIKIKGGDHRFTNPEHKKKVIQLIQEEIIQIN